MASAALLCSLVLAVTSVSGAPADLVGCGTHALVPDQMVTIQTTNFPQPYNTFERCQWEFSCPAAEDNQLEFTCPTFELQASTDCTADRLILASRGERFIKCGTDSPDGTVTRTGWARLTFYSGANIVKKGFRCAVWCRAIPPTPATTAAPTTTIVVQNMVIPCTPTRITRLAVGQSVRIESPNFPAAYESMTRCQWEFSCPDETLNELKVKCPEFDLEKTANCSHDKLKFTMRENTEDLCNGSSFFSTTVTGWARFTFSSNGNVQKTGFRCYVRCKAKAK